MQILYLYLSADRLSDGPPSSELLLDGPEVLPDGPEVLPNGPELLPDGPPSVGGSSGFFGLNTAKSSSESGLACLQNNVFIFYSLV